MFVVQSKNRVFFYTGENAEGEEQVEALSDISLAHQFESEYEAQLCVDSLSTFQTGYEFEVVQVAE